MLFTGNYFSVFAVYITLKTTKANENECFVTNSILSGRVLSLQYQLADVEKNFMDFQNQLSAMEMMFMVKLKQQAEEINNTLQNIQTELEYYRQLNETVLDLKETINQTAGTVELLKSGVQKMAETGKS